MNRAMLFLSVVLVGCGQQKLSVPTQNGKSETVKQRDLTDHDKVALLRAEAAKRGIRWRVWCIWWAQPDQPGFMGSAYRKGEPDDQYHDRWLETGYTQAEASYKLYVSIQGDPTHPAEEREEVKKEKEYRRVCPRELSDLNNNEPCSDCKIEEVKN